MQLYIIRHAQSINNAIGQGESEHSSDSELTAVGRRQAELLADFLAQTGEGRRNGGRFGLTHLYTSLMMRAVATADVIASAVSLPAVAWAEIHEIGGLFSRSGERGGLPGPNRAGFAKRFPDLVLPDWLGEQGWWNRPFEENPTLVLERAEGFVDRLMDEHGGTDDRVAVVTHGGFFRALRRILLGVPEGSPPFGHPDEPRPKIYNTSLSRIDFVTKERSAAGLVFLNCVDHLSADLLT